MDRLSHLRGEAGGSRDSTLDTTSPPSESFMTANESSSKYYSLSEVDSTFDISSIKDVSLASTTTDSEGTITNTEDLISNLSPIGNKSDMLDSYKIGKQIEAANILSGGVDIFDDNDNSYDGDELVIDDNVDLDDKSNSELKQEDGLEYKSDENMIESTLINEEADIASKDTEVVLQIDGKNVDAIDIGNGLYLYRKEGQEELAAVQIIDDDQQQTSFKFLKVRENAEGNLEVYEEIEIEVPKEVPAREGKTADKKISSHVPIKDINKVISESVCNKVAERKNKTPKKEPISTTTEVDLEVNKEASPDSKTELNLNGKMMKFSESRKSPVIGSFTPMTYHSTPNKERIPLTKTMVDQQLHPNRHSDNVKKTIEVHTDSSKQKPIETLTKCKDSDDNKIDEITSTEKEIVISESNLTETVAEEPEQETIDSKKNDVNIFHLDERKSDEDTVDSKCSPKEISSAVPMEQDCLIDSTENDLNKDKVASNEITQSENVNEEELKNIGSVDSGIVLSISENMEVDKEAARIEKSDQGKSINQAKVDDIIKIQEKDTKADESKQVANNGKGKIDQVGQSDKIIKAIVKDNTHGDSQDKTKAKEIIYDISADQQNVDEIIVIEDNEINETLNEKNTTVKGKLSASHLGNKTAEIIKTNIQKGTKGVLDIKVMDDNKPKLVESGQDSKVKDAKDTKNIQADKAASPETQKEKLIKDETSTLSKVAKNIHSKIPQIASNKVSTKPTSGVSNAGVELDNKQSSKGNASTLRKMAEGAVLNKIQPQAKHSTSKAPEGTQQISLGLDKPQDKLKIVPEIVHDKKPIPNKTATIEMQKSDKKMNVLEKSPKKDPRKPITVAESQVSGTPVEVLSKAKVEASIKDKIISEKGMSNVVEKQKSTTSEKSQSSPELKPQAVIQKLEKLDSKVLPKETVTAKVDIVKDVKVSNVLKDEPVPGTSKQDVSSTSTDGTNSLQNKESNSDADDKKEVPAGDETKPTNNKAAVPFGKWTATNRKEFLDKIKNRVPATPTPSTSNQLKNSNDLNRRDVLQKIDSQRQTSNALNAKTQEANKHNIKNETQAAFTNKTNITNKDNDTQETKVLLKTETVTSIADTHKATVKEDVTVTTKTDILPAATVSSVTKVEGKGITEVNYQDLIDKTIEDMLHRTSVPPKLPQDESNLNTGKDLSGSQSGKFPPNYQPTDQATLDAIEMQMNELHGIPFIERPPHELPQVPLPEPKTKSEKSKVDKEKQPVPTKTTKIPNLLPFTNKTQEKIIKESAIEVDSEDEIIEHEPITGDIDLNKKGAAKLSIKGQLSHNNTDKSSTDAAKKESIITEKDFDKFARRNSITYENRLTVNFDGKEPHNVIQTVVEKDPSPKSYSRNDISRVDPKAKLTFKYQNMRQSTHPTKQQHSNKFGPTNDDTSNRNQSKLQKAYHSALTAKRQMEFPITIIEDKPVKVVFMENNMEFVPSQLNVQGPDLSPVKKLITESDNITVSTCGSLDSDALDTTDDAKSQEEVKTKTKHQRKQVLTPVDEPELELIEPKDLGLEASPKKKRKIDDDKTDKNVKYPMRKKYYLLGSNAVMPEEKNTHVADAMKNPLKETINRNDNGVAHKNTVSAIDNLVKAAELLEHQSENMIITDSPNSDSQQSTPVKRGRGRPRKYPLPDGGTDNNKVPSPQKKPRLIDAKPPKRDTTTDDDEDDDSDDQMIKENWTMGKINENIVCPICNKLFRTENVVFKHVKHCTGPSPSRSDSDKRSPRRIRQSQESDSKSRGSQSDDMDFDDDKPLVVRKETPKKRKSKDSVAKSDEISDVIVIEDTPDKEKPEKKEKEVDERKHHESRATTKPRAKVLHKNNDLVCEFCGKTFRQLSYLVSHKLQHKKEDPKKTEKEASVLKKTEKEAPVMKKTEKEAPVVKKTEKDAPVTNKSVYSCEVCKKEFRKLHHLVQHRIIHNPSSVPTRSLRKSSSEQSDSKIEKEPGTSKQSEDLSAGFRCEPCDKSFRKLHHLVEHRETHDGINRQKTTTVTQNNVEKPAALHQCEICKKTFRKLHHMIEHKEQHVETSSEKSDDKSVKSSLSTRDIIHECSLCYMVFPNEHSLNKHTIICQRKKRQSKQTKPTEESETIESVEDVTDSLKIDEKIELVDSPKPVVVEVKDDEDKMAVIEEIEVPKEKPEPAKEKPAEIFKETEKVQENVEPPIIEPQISPAKRDFAESENKIKEEITEVPEKMKKIEVKENTKINETPKKKTSLKEKSTASASKRLKTTAPVTDDVKAAVESSDDDEVRYMLNPDFKLEDTSEEKVFMKVRANKRSSLQIERPNSKDLVKRRTSLQHPPKIPRLKPKAVETNTVTVKNVPKTPKVEPVPSTDSDDSETVKYSFPKTKTTIPEKPTKTAQERTPKDVERKTQKKTLADKRKSLSGIAKRKSLGKAVTAKHKPSPMKPIKRRTLEVEHRCDCGQLFSSAALLSRHTTLAHTPPRIRRRRSPPPEVKPVIKPAPRKSSAAEKPKQTPVSRKSSARSDSCTSTNAKPNKTEAKPTRKSLDRETKTPADARKPKPEKSEAKSSVKPKRTSAHRGVPVPEKMRKLMQKNNK